MRSLRGGLQELDGTFPDKKVAAGGGGPALYDNSAEGFSVSPSTTLSSGSFAVAGSNRVLYAFVGSGAGTPVDPSTVKWNTSESFTQISSTLTFGTSSNGKFSVWRLINPTATTSTVNIVWGSTQDERLVIAASFKDCNQTTPNGTVATDTGIFTEMTVGTTCDSVSGDLVVDASMYLQTDSGHFITMTAGGSQSSKQEIEQLDMVFEGMGVSTLTASGSTTAMSWTLSGQINLSAQGGSGSFSMALKGV